MDQDSVMLAVLAIVAVAAIVALTVIQWRRQRLVEASLHQRERSLEALISRFGDVAEFVEFANSADAQRLFQVIDGPTMIARRLLAMTAAAVVLSAVGCGFLLNRLGVPLHADINAVREAQDARWWGIMLLAVGTGLAVGAWVCARLARRWGVLDQ